MITVLYVLLSDVSRTVAAVGQLLSHVQLFVVASCILFFIVSFLVFFFFGCVVLISIGSMNMIHITQSIPETEVTKLFSAFILL